MAGSLKATKSREDSKSDERQEIDNAKIGYDANEKDSEFGGPIERAKLERRLLLKVDIRMGILVVIYM